MKLTKYIFGVALGVLSLACASCYNADRDFPDYEGGTTAYFAYQYPVRTLILGNASTLYVRSYLATISTTTRSTTRTSAAFGPQWVVPMADATPRCRFP